MTEAQFYGNISVYWTSEMAAFAPFDSVAAAADFEADILMPMDTTVACSTGPAS